METVSWLSASRLYNEQTTLLAASFLPGGSSQQKLVEFDESLNLETSDSTDQKTPDMQNGPIFATSQDENGEPPESVLQRHVAADDGRLTDGSIKANMFFVNNSPIQVGLHAALRAKRKRTQNKMSWSQWERVDKNR